MDERDRIIQHRLSRAREALDEADAMARTGHWNTAVNRLYYACFYAATSLLLRHGISRSRHSGVLSVLNRDFIRTGVLDPDLGRLYNDLFDNRHEADYVDFVQFDEPRVRPWMDGARRFVDHVEKLLRLEATQ